MSLNNAGFTVVNTFIVGNGNSLATTFGGVRINNGAGVAPQRFELNTVANNAALAAAASAGVECTTGDPMTASSSVVFLTTGGMASVTGSCAWAFSDIEGGAPGEGNIDADPLFVDPSTGDYHLQPNSPCIDAADPASTVATDFDGDARPQGDRADMGADEVVE